MCTRVCFFKYYYYIIIIMYSETRGREDLLILAHISFLFGSKTNTNTLPFLISITWYMPTQTPQTLLRAGRPTSIYTTAVTTTMTTIRDDDDGLRSRASFCMCIYLYIIFVYYARFIINAGHPKTANLDLRSYFLLLYTANAPEHTA